MVIFPYSEIFRTSRLLWFVTESSEYLTRRLEREALTGRRRRAQVLLAADRQQTDAQIAAATGAAVHRRTPTQAFRP